MAEQDAPQVEINTAPAESESDNGSDESAEPETDDSGSDSE